MNSKGDRTEGIKPPNMPIYRLTKYNLAKDGSWEVNMDWFTSRAPIRVTWSEVWGHISKAYIKDYGQRYSQTPTAHTDGIITL